MTRVNEKFRFWNLTTIKETYLDKKTHGLFLGHSSSLYCRKSFYDIWRKSYNGLGKGDLSRSEPLFSHPNPTFNSIGRASREKDRKREKSHEKWNLENLRLNQLETFYIYKKRTLEFQKIFSKEEIWEISNKNNPFFLWKYYLFKNFREKDFQLKSGSKFGGSYLVYTKKEISRIHLHSVGVVFFFIFGLWEKKCINCLNRFPLEWEDLQTRTRLAQQVSKKFFFICVSDVRKKSDCFCKKNGILQEIILERWVI